MYTGEVELVSQQRLTWVVSSLSLKFRCFHFDHTFLYQSIAQLEANTSNTALKTDPSTRSVMLIEMDNPSPFYQGFHSTNTQQM
jgi:hypothetical protein